MAQCERTVSRHSRPIRHALASTSLGPLKYLERSLSISLSLSLSLCTHLIGCLLLTCTVCVVYVPSGRLPSLSADEKSGSSLWITRRPFAFFFAWHSGTVMKCGPIYYGNKNSDFTTRRWLSILIFLPMPDSMHTTTVSIISRWKFWNLLMLQWNQDGPSL